MSWYSPRLARIDTHVLHGMHGHGLRCHCQASVTGVTKRAIKVRPWKPSEDIDQLGRLWEEALLSQGLTSFGKNFKSSEVDSMRASAMAQLHRSHDRKQKAAEDSRTVNAEMNGLTRELLLLTTSLQQQSQPTTVSRQLDSSSASQQPRISVNLVSWEQRNLAARKEQLNGLRMHRARLRRRRLWCCLVALASPSSSSDTSSTRTNSPDTGNQSSQQTLHGSPEHTAISASSSIAGYILVSMKQPLALLPPPFPSNTPLVTHVDALAVGQQYRRQGVASALLDAAEKLCRRWGQSSLWLEVEANNQAAVQLYIQRRYKVIKNFGWPWRSGSKLILRKALVNRHVQDAGAQGSQRRQRLLSAATLKKHATNASTIGRAPLSHKDALHDRGLESTQAPHQDSISSNEGRQVDESSSAMYQSDAAHESRSLGMVKQNSTKVFMWDE